MPLRHTIASSALATQHYHKWLDGVSDALAYGLRKLRPYARAYPYRGLRAFASLSMARSVGAVLVLILMFAGQWAQADKMELRIIELRHRTAEELIPIVRPLLGPQSAISGEGHHLIIRETKKNLRELARAVKNLDTPRRNLRITVRHVAAAEASRTAPRYSITRRYAAGRRERTQVLNVLDGTPAFIVVGQSIPEVQHFLALAPDQLVLAQGVQYRDVTTGFQVLPRSAGDYVELEIAPKLSFLTNRGTQVVNFHELATRVRLRLGDWFDLGGTKGSRHEVSRAILKSWHTSGDEEFTVLVKVEEILSAN